MEGYTIRKALLSDSGFLAKIIIGAEKSNSGKLGLGTLFNLQESEVKSLIVNMLEEEIDGCEFSVSSFLITEYKDEPIAAVGGWVEGLSEGMPSSVLKSNLVSFTFPKEGIKYLYAHSDIISDIQIERESFSLQIEYVFVDPNHRGKRIAEQLIKEHHKNALSLYPKLDKVQVQVFENNTAAIKLYERIGFKIVNTYVSKIDKVLDFLPFGIKLLMEKQ